MMPFRRARNRLVSIGTVAVAVSVTMSACGSPSVQPPRLHSRADESSGPQRLSGALYVPFAGVLAGRPRIEAIMHQASEEAVSACMAMRGYVYHPERYVAPLAEGDSFTDLAFARVHGYHLPAPADEDALHPSNHAELDGLNDDQRRGWRQALLGLPVPRDPRTLPHGADRFISIRLPHHGSITYDASSCAVRGLTRVYGDVQVWRQTQADVSTLRESVFEAMSSDSDYIQSISSWRDCMRRMGYEYSEPRSAADSFIRQGSAPPSRAEISAAVADVSCYRTLGLATVRTDLTKKYERVVARQHPGLLNRMRRLLRLAEARTIGR